MFYTGVGSRKTPKSIQDLMTRIARYLPLTLRSGGAPEADKAFEKGATYKEIYLPKENHYGSKSKLIGASDKAYEIASKTHPNWEACDEYVRVLHARNVHQVLGREIHISHKSKFLICWTPNAKKVGGTATAITLAESNGIPVFNLANKNTEEFFRRVLEKKPHSQPITHIEDVKITNFEYINKLIEEQLQDTFSYRAVWYGDVDYYYSGIRHKSRQMGNELQAIARKVEIMLSAPPGYFNSVLINKFPKGIGIGYHDDGEDIFRDGFNHISQIAVLSYGGEATIAIKKDTEKIGTLRVKNDSLYMMPGGTFQDNFKHKVGNCSEDRISLTFRRTVMNHAIDLQYGVKEFFFMTKPDIEVRPIFNLDNIEYTNINGLVSGSNLIAEHINKNSKIVIIVDYDADGVDCGGLGYDFFTLIGYKNFEVVVNERRYGNGVNIRLIKDVITDDVDLIITADHGSANEITYRYIDDHYTNIDIVVTDHHKFKSKPTSINAFINPQENNIPIFNKVSGCAVLFFTLCEVNKKLETNIDMVKLLTYVGVTTITDMQDMSVELNRAFVIAGLRLINSAVDDKWSHLADLTKSELPLISRDIGFTIGPMLNACGRMGMARVAMDFFKGDHHHSLMTLRKMEMINKKKKFELARLTKEAYVSLAEYKKHYKFSNVALIPTGHGLSGIIAARIGEKYRLPTLALAHNEETYKGSGRAIIDNFDFEKAITTLQLKHKDVVKSGGGHPGAIGCEIYTEEIDSFFKLFDEYCKNNVDLDNITPTETNPIKSNQIDFSLLDLMRSLEPFGLGWKEPVFVSNVKIKSVKNLDKNNIHSKLVIITDDLREIRGVRFDTYQQDKRIDLDKHYRITFTVGIDFFDKTKLSIVINLVEEI